MVLPFSLQPIGHSLVSMHKKIVWGYYKTPWLFPSPVLHLSIMDQDYERRLLRQINIQNENMMPSVNIIKHLKFFCIWYKK